MGIMLIVMVFFISCSSGTENNKSANTVIENKILQKSDGTISLNVEKAELYHDMENPATNTAEWNVLVSKSGRFKVWLSSETKDTTNLQYENSVMLSVLDNRIEGVPEVDRVIKNTNGKFPFLADSFMGELFIQDTGLYHIQVISEKIVPENYSIEDNSRLISVILTPTVN